VEVVTSVQRRRRWIPEQKLEIVKQTNEPGSSVSLVARQHLKFDICDGRIFLSLGSHGQRQMLHGDRNKKLCKATGPVACDDICHKPTK